MKIAGDDDPTQCVIFDDSVRNLAPAREIGFYTILVGKNGTDPKVDRSISSLHDLKDMHARIVGEGSLISENMKSKQIIDGSRG